MKPQNYFDQLGRKTKNPTLRATQYFMAEFGHPEEKLKFIHIAGTNGKGSCAEMMTNILVKAGYRVGTFMSPHLEKYNERIRINQHNITDREIDKLMQKIAPKMEQYNAENTPNVTAFELETTMAILHFFEQKCDLVVFETGLGGLNDCTNIVKPLVSMITSIGYDHMNILGNTLAEITEQKAGIIKENSQTVFAQQDEKVVNDIIKQNCQEKQNTLHLVRPSAISNVRFQPDFQAFDYKNDTNILVNLKGKKQIKNAAMCIECVEVLRNQSYVIPEEAMREGLKTVVHKGRFEIINHNPEMVFDGAHNQMAIENFRNNVQMYYENRKKVYLFSILKTKDYVTILKELLQDSNSIFVFTSGNNKDEYVAKEDLLEEAKKLTNPQNLYAQELEDALDFAQENYPNHVIFIVGSFYIYGTVIEKLRNDKND